MSEEWKSNLMKELEMTTSKESRQKGSELATGQIVDRNGKI